MSPSSSLDILFPLTFIGCKLETKIPLIVSLLKQWAIDENRKIFLYSFRIRSGFYCEKLISSLSGIDYKLIRSYRYPYIGISKNSKEKIDRDSYIEAIERIQRSQLIMSSQKGILKEDIVDYLLGDNDFELLLIDDFDYFVLESNYDKETIMKRLEQYASNHRVMILLGGEKNRIQEFQKQYQSPSISFYYGKRKKKQDNCVLLERIGV